MARISPDTVAAVEQATDIVSLISEYIPLKRAGKDFKALCPFHNEKTPSFFVSPSKQIYKCFGCGEGGNAFGFLMAVEKVTFTEAVRMLAERAGITVKETRRDEGETSGVDKEKLYRANEWAAREYEKYLGEDARGEAARRVSRSSGVSSAGIRSNCALPRHTGWVWRSLLTGGGWIDPSSSRLSSRRCSQSNQISASESWERLG